MKTDIDTIPNLYSITGNILDINTLLINREELRKLCTSVEAIAALAHTGGFVGMSERDALISIRRISLPYWDSKVKTSHKVMQGLT